MALEADGQKVSQFQRLAFLRSPNFSTGISGWSINQDGSAEFNNVVIRNGQIVSGAALFYSSSPPAVGNLVGSINANTVATTDTPGNTVLPGITNYLPGTPAKATQLFNGSLFFLKAATVTGTYNAVASIITDNAGDLIISSSGSAQVEVLDLLAASLGAAITGGLTTDTLLVSTGSAAGAIADIVNTTANPTAANARITVAAAGDPVLSARVSGDTVARLLADITAGGLTRIRAGAGGASALDCALIRAAAAQWMADPIAFNNNGAAEVPLTVGGTGAAFANSWANAGAPGAGLQYARNAAPYHTMSWVGRITAPVGLAANQAITGAVAAAYRPSHTQKVAAIDVTTGAAVRLSFGSTGVLTYQSGSAVGDSIDVGDLVYLDA